ncbi:MAG: hypothetical protein EB034_20375, partial [Verrucomicrobia bacterium]|nr:hypothetical protein [Verrucomicrobiota bacterium]
MIAFVATQSRGADPARRERDVSRTVIANVAHPAGELLLLLWRHRRFWVNTRAGKLLAERSGKTNLRELQLLLPVRVIHRFQMQRLRRDKTPLREVEAQPDAVLAVELVDREPHIVGRGRRYFADVHRHRRVGSGPATEGFRLQLRQRLLRFEAGRIHGQLREVFVALAGDFVGGEFFEDLQLLRGEQLFRVVRHRRFILLQPFVEPPHHGHLQLLRVLVRAFGEDQAELLRLVVQVVDGAHALMEPHHTIKRENSVLVGVADEQGARSYERGDLRVVPAVSVHHEHAVTMPLDAAVHDVALEVHNASGGTRGLDAVVERSNPPRISAAAAAPRDANARAIHI